MSLAARIAPHLPYLRRYGRALTGSQSSGDAYVAATLEAIIADKSIFPETSSDRVSLYQLFGKLLDSLRATTRFDVPESPFAWEQNAAARLAMIPHQARQAFLLTAVEQFSPQEVAEILEIDQPTLSGLMDQAAQEISDQVATSIMIIEDEPLIAMDIENIVSDLGHKVTGIARTYKEAVALFNQSAPKMVLADIQLADGSSGIDAVNDILRTSSVPVIFITAYPQRLLTGERPEPTFLVVKPFDPSMVKALISQALFFNTSDAKAA